MTAKRALAPVIVLLVAYGAWWLLGSVLAADANEVHLVRTYAIAAAAEFVAVCLASLGIMRLERPGKRPVINHLRHALLLYLVAIGVALLLPDSGHMSHLLGFMFALTCGAIVGNMFGIILYDFYLRRAEA